MLRPSPNHGTQRLPNDDYGDGVDGLGPRNETPPRVQSSGKNMNHCLTQ